MGLPQLREMPPAFRHIPEEEGDDSFEPESHGPATGIIEEPELGPDGESDPDLPPSRVAWDFREGGIKSVKRPGNGREPVLEKLKLSLNEEVEKAASVDQLCFFLEERGMGLEASVVRETFDYLNGNMDSIILYTVTSQEDPHQKEFARRFAGINPPVVREKVRTLMKREMNKVFEARRKEFTQKAVAEVASLEAMYRVLEQFKEIREGDKVYDKTRVISIIKNAEKSLNLAVEAGTLGEVGPERIGAEVESVLRGVPYDAGIFDKASELLTELVKEKRVQNFIKKSSSSEEPKAGFLRKWGGRISKFFSRK